MYLQVAGHAIQALLLLCLSPTSAHAALSSPPSQSNDPLADTFGTPATKHDIAGLRALVSASEVTFVVDFYDPIAAPSDFAPSSVVGYIDIDLDQRADTGAVAKKSQFSPAGDGGLGAEIYIDLFSERFHPGQAEVVDAAKLQSIGLAKVAYTTTGFLVSVPLDLFNGDGLLNYGAIVGDFLDMSDEAPNVGYFTTVVPEPSANALLLFYIARRLVQRRRN